MTDLFVGEVGQYVGQDTIRDPNVSTTCVPGWNGNPSSVDTRVKYFRKDISDLSRDLCDTPYTGPLSTDCP